MRCNVSYRRWLAVGLGVIAVVGCAKKGNSLREAVVACADLAQTKATNHGALREEIDRISGEGELPLQLQQTLPPDEENVAAALAAVLDPMLINGIVDRGRELFPVHRFTHRPVELRQAAAFREKYQPKLDRVYAAIKRPRCDFGVAGELGYFFEPEFIRDVEGGFYLLACEAAEGLATDRPSRALGPLEAMLQLVEHLSQAGCIEARCKAAELRAEALLVVEAVAHHRHVTAEDLVRMYRVLHGQLQRWPKDRDALIADRAQTLHAYEAIRRGMLRWILTAEEKERFQEQGISKHLAGVMRDTVDEDELFYLRAMRRYISAADHPYFERAIDFRDVEEELLQLRSRENYPFAAAQLFLPGVETSQRATARDRARCEAWTLALAHAIGVQPPPPLTRNPFTGATYQVRFDGKRVLVDLGAADERGPIAPILRQN